MIKKYKRIWIPLGCFFFIMTLLLMDFLLPFDLWIYKKISLIIHDPITTIMKYITFLGETSTIIIFSIIWSFFLFFKNKGELKPFSIIIFLSLLCILFLKPIFARERPDILRLIPIDGYSFPSGHSIISASFYGYFITYFAGKQKTFLLCVLACIILGIGFSRIYLGVHYLSDVLAGYSIGTIVLEIGTLFRKKGDIK